MDKTHKTYFLRPKVVNMIKSASLHGRYKVLIALSQSFKKYTHLNWCPIFGEGRHAFKVGDTTSLTYPWLIHIQRRKAELGKQSPELL